MTTHGAEPLISVIMANYNGAAHIAAAVRSVLAQTETSLELIVSDDGSCDDSIARATAAAEGDARMVILRSVVRSGPAGARNRALAAAHGRWIAIVDNDDLIEPLRLASLTAAAEVDGADIAADNLLVFHEDDARRPRPHLPKLEQPRWISASAYARSNLLLRGGAPLGYLKPIFRRAPGVAYDESLRIGEDADLIQRLLIAGARMRLYPGAGYRYRKHAASISHRLNRAAVEAMLAAHDHLDPGEDADLQQALQLQRSALLDARAFVDLIAALKAKDWGGAFQTALARPGALWLLREPIGARLSRLWPAAVKH